MYSPTSPVPSSDEQICQSWNSGSKSNNFIPLNEVLLKFVLYLTYTSLANPSSIILCMAFQCISHMSGSPPHQYISFIVFFSIASTNSCTTCVSWNFMICSLKGDAIHGCDSLLHLSCFLDSASQLLLNISPHILHLKLHRLLNL